MMDYRLWHNWFAWRPVKTDTGWVWFETIKRRGAWCVSTDPIWNWRYARLDATLDNEPMPGELEGRAQYHNWDC